MKVFIFGAGASLGSQTDVTKPDQKSPLVNELFSSDYQRYYQELFKNTIELEEYRNELGGDIGLEEWLTSWWTRIGQLKNESTKQAEKKSLGKIVYYLWWLFQNVSETYSGLNSYTKLLKKLRKNDEDVGFISFNYDTLFDRAYHDIYGARLYGEINNYLQARLIKPHGSINWLLPKRDADPGFSGESRLDSYARYSVASSCFFNGPPLSMEKIAVIQPDHSDLEQVEFITNDRFARQYFLPLIFIPLSIKMYSFVVEFSEKIIKSGQNLLGQAEEIYIVGYRGEDDIMKKDFLQSIKKNTTLHVVSMKSADDIKGKMISLQPNLKPGLSYSEGFADFVDKYK